MSLNSAAAKICREIVENAERLRVSVVRCPSGATLLDCGVKAPGGLEAGRRLAEVCTAGLADVSLFVAPGDPWRVPGVAVRTDHPVTACMASQYAGWRIAVDGFFAMGSGPMRAAGSKEPLIEELGCRERGATAVGVLECAKLPPPEVCRHIARECGVPPGGLTLLVARTASLAGTFQVVARSVETALHKLHELGFDLGRIAAAFGAAPLPPVAGDDLAAIGRTNDAILYGAEVTLWVRGDDDALAALGPRLPSAASSDYGAPFADTLRRCGGDFYRIDPLLFAPAAVALFNLDTGRAHRFGRPAPELLARSFSHA